VVAVSVVIATIPPRADKLGAVLSQLDAQTYQPHEVIVECDEEGDGAAVTRNRGIAKATGEFIAFFDDDDIMYPSHLEHLVRWQAATGADFVYPWHDIKPWAKNPLKVRGESPFGRLFDKVAKREITDRDRNFIPIAVLVRRTAMLSIDGFRYFPMERWDPSKCEVLDAWKRLLLSGAQFAHCPKKTWCAVRDGENTAGLRWQDHIGTKQKGYD
jgi:glycosyltransferase involved in cell wall biosynthesis